MIQRKNTELFSQRAEKYALYRPHYPAEIIPFLEEEIGLVKNWIIADIGSGTGISSELFLQNGNMVYAIEPNQDMRLSAEDRFKGNPKFISIHATAESTSLKDKSIHLILAGQAFHWFEKKLSKKEFQRIAAQDAYLLLMWNERNMDSLFQQAYEQMLVEFAPSYIAERHTNIDEAAIHEFFSPYPYKLKTFSSAQLLDLEGLKGRLLSCSYAPLEHEPNYTPIMNQLAKIFDLFSVDGKIEFPYRCKLYYGKIMPSQQHKE